MPLFLIIHLSLFTYIMIFLTYNDAPDGIYFSQVIDVCRYWESEFKERARLIAFISLHDFFVNKKKIRFAWPDSFVFPMVPGIENWRLNISRLRAYFWFRKKENVIARGVFATLLALECKKIKKVCFDARGAYNAEWTEYLINHSPTLSSGMKELEKEALLKPDFRLAVSQKLVDYWKTEYNYTLSSHVLIPCTLDSSSCGYYDKDAAMAIRQGFNVKKNEILLVYSGSSAQWQSFEKMEEYITKAFHQNPNIKLLLLAKAGIEKSLAEQFPGRIMQAWVKPDEVNTYLSAADYGLLIRAPSVTNAVSSPVKFAEYLAAGLQVVISDNIGDYSHFVKEKGCGMLADSVSWGNLQRPAENEKLRIQEIAKFCFTKATYKEDYRKIREM